MWSKCECDHMLCYLQVICLEFLACIKQKSSTLSLFPITFLACMYEEIYLAVHVVVVVVWRGESTTRKRCIQGSIYVFNGILPPYSKKILFGQRHDLQSLTLIFIFVKIFITKLYIYIFMKIFSKTNLFICFFVF